MQTIKLSVALKDLVLCGRKTRTMRSGVRNYKTGPAVFEIVGDTGKTTGEKIPVDIKEVIVKPFGDITDEDAIYEGYEKAEELKAALWYYYPALSDSDFITSISFSVVKC